MATLRRVQKEATRQLFLTTAVEMFETNGYGATTIDDIARGAGTTRTTFYLHFSSRSELMQALLEQVTSGLFSEDEDDLLNFAAVVRRGKREEIVEFLTRASDLWEPIRPIVSAVHQAAALDPEIRAILDDWIALAFDQVEIGLNQAGRFDPRTRHVRAVFAFSQLEWLSLRWMRHGWDIDRDIALGLLADTWVELLCEPESP